MPTSPQRKLPLQAGRPAFRTLQGWALGTLIEQGAVVECEHHGHRRDRADPDAWNRGRQETWRNPFPGAAPEACPAAIDEVTRHGGNSWHVPKALLIAKFGSAIAFGRTARCRCG